MTEELLPAAGAAQPDARGHTLGGAAPITGKSLPCPWQYVMHRERNERGREKDEMSERRVKAEKG
jgi:hypothetical protein